jgi:hypothetical protein
MVVNTWLRSTLKVMTRVDARGRAQRAAPSPAMLAKNVLRVRLTAHTLSCAARAHAPKPLRHAGCREHARRHNTRCATCMTPSRFCSAEALQRRAEAGPQRLQREVSPRDPAGPRT